MGLTKILDTLKNMIALLAPQLKKATSKVGVTDTRQAVVGLMAVAVFLAKQFKDGVQFTDFVSFYTELTQNEEFKKKLEDAWNGHQQISEEVKDIDAGEGLEILGDIAGHVPELVESLKKDTAPAVEAPAADAPVADAPASDAPQS